ncbi:hypothetical protein [Pseudomonas sp.]|uniref:hypothetical protein n=1 Tax=Pseudomonas sp. TaxID=306 RepID=UPI002C8A7E3C|nr:hypothetical protein [Pseudomonas sp.]HUE92318.1 hypothetical protein [Pseudomonas sp.]
MQDKPLGQTGLTTSAVVLGGNVFWIARNPGLRDRLTLFTEVGAAMGPGAGGLSRAWQLRMLVEAAELALSADELALLDIASI